MVDLIILLILVVGIILTTAKWKINPFLALLGALAIARRRKSTTQSL